MVRQNYVHVLFVKMKGVPWVTVGGTVQGNHNTIKSSKKVKRCDLQAKDALRASLL